MQDRAILVWGLHTGLNIQHEIVIIHHEGPGQALNTPLTILIGPASIIFCARERSTGN